MNYQNQEKLISVKTAILARAKGFNVQNTREYWNIKDQKQYGERVGFSPELYDCDDKNHLPLVTQGLLQQWLREIQNIHVTALHKYVTYAQLKPDHWSYILRKGESEESWPSYQEALEHGLVAGLEKIN